MAWEAWTSWPSREALSREGAGRTRARIGVAVRVAVAVALVSATFGTGRFTGWAALGMALALVVVGFALHAFHRVTLEHRLPAALGQLAVFIAAGFGARVVDAPVMATILWCGVAVTAMQRLPLAAAVSGCLAALGCYAAVSRDGWLATGATAVGLALLGYLLRLDAEARGTAQRLLAQERVARSAEAETAALAERARIAREIHDVLAHSLSAQLVHLEAARLMLDSGTAPEQVRERVVAARRMALEGLTETRQALSALRGEFTPVGEFLAALAAAEGARLEVEGVARPLAADAGLAVRRTAQEAVTNVRKHAAGAGCVLRLRYLEHMVELEVRNTRTGRREGLSELAASGSGYGLLGMRERAELLGGTLESGPDEGGWRVRLRVPA
ncbi:histidine kinase [Streptacidiphilus griseoplanus]|uniref:histidine kinase n=1 Tax=Peterkaempfera griseoplana TaxID=66896 RepID=UPI0006E432A4|nr:histidine kinase [Peterkaempfera griseoplana]